MEQPGYEMPDTLTIKRYVLVLYTGGTIGMKESEDGLVPQPKYLESLMKLDPWLNDPDYKLTREDHDRMPMTLHGKLDPLAMKETEDGYRIVYGILEFKPLLDSSNMNMEDWTKMVEYIEKYYQKFDGFVILHGTDTMAYTSSALAFMLEGLGKAVVITGSQVPLFQLRTDAEQNLKGALIMAGRYAFEIPEVTLFFNDILYRGCRATKINASGFSAFGSPNFKPLAEVGVNVTVDDKNIFYQKSRLTIYKHMSPKVGVLRLSPGITEETVREFLKPLKGAVLQTFGAGNAPNDIVPALDEATSSGRVLIVNVTQCLEGTVEGIYATGNQLIEAGVVPGADMTPEAAMTKLSFLVGQAHQLNYQQMQQYLQLNLRGELTATKPPITFPVHTGKKEEDTGKKEEDDGH